MKKILTYSTLKIDQELYDFVRDEALPGSSITLEQFWMGLEDILTTLAPQNLFLLQKRDTLQEKLDAWYLSKREILFSQSEHQEFLKSIDYLVSKSDDYKITTSHVDPEIADIAGPQLVVPSDNARYALNAANARWGSLFDALYGTDMICEEAPYQKGEEFNPKRGQKVFEFAFNFLDDIAPLENGNYAQVEHISIKDSLLNFTLDSKKVVGLKEPLIFAGYLGSQDAPSSILLKHNDLHVEIILDKTNPIGSMNKMGMKDLVIESALSTIQDCEDSVAAVDTSDKLKIYRNWNGMMRGNLETTFENKGKVIHRTLNPDKTFITPNGQTLTLKGRTLLLIRNVGMHMYTDAVTMNGEEIPEGFLDAMVTALCAIHDLKRDSGIKNSATGSIYIVKPKCHGKDEISLMVALFEQIETVLNLPRNTIKIGIMDEERRTTVNLKETIYSARERVFFINTGFLDRTGDEIHSCMELGPVLPKEEIKQELWLKGYENQNVDVGMEIGFKGHAQIGKGMWTMPELMASMVDSKISHPLSGANTAWVPSPVAATLHALHYHKVNVTEVQKALATRQRASLDDILTPPLLKRTLSREEITNELENNIQSILGYVVRWIDQGIGCSKVLDINNVALMEDRATLRISSQHVANWLYHGITNEKEITEVFEKMALVVDKQNLKDINYNNMSPKFNDSIAFQAALDLVFKGKNQPNGYTEFILHTRRREVKNKNL